MDAPHTHLEHDRIEQLREQYSREGYEVRTADAADEGIDLLASRDGKQIAVIVRETGSISSARRSLRPEVASRYDEIRLVVATRPAPNEIEVEGLQEGLEHHLLTDAPHPALDSLSSHTRIEGVEDLEVHHLRITDAGYLLLRGRAVVEVSLEYGGGESKDGVTHHDAFPMQFELVFDPRERAVVAVESLDIDTSSFYG